MKPTDLQAVPDDADGVLPGRRLFLRNSAALGGGLLLNFVIPPMLRDAVAAPAASAFAPNAVIRIDRLGKVTLTMPYVEMGQGTYTAIPMLIAEELEVGLADVQLEHAGADDKLFINPALGFQVTGGSTSIRVAWEPMRRAGATARTLLVMAAAQRWQVDAASCHAEQGSVVHAASARRLPYGELVDAAAALPLPQPSQVQLKAPQQFKLIGTAAKRLDTPGKLNGSAQYGIDVTLPGLKVAALAIAPSYGGRLKSVDARRALAVKGVRQVVKMADGVAVVADHTGAARKGLALLKIVWDDGANARLSSADMRADMARAAAGNGATVRREGDPVQAMAGASRRIEAVYELPFLAHATMEPMNCTVHVTPQQCEVWVGTQVMTRARAAAARISGLPEAQVIVHNFLLGGGFGRRLEIDGIERAVQIGMQVKGPVKVIWSREEDIQHDMYRPYFYDQLAAGLDAQGWPVAWSHRVTGSSVLGRFMPPAFNNGFDPETMDGAAQPPYALPNIDISYVRHEPPQIPTAFWRGVGPTHNVFVVESFLDELAAAAGIDALRYRERLLAHNPRALATLQLAAKQAGWGTPLPAGQGRGVSVQYAFGTYMTQIVEASVGADGEVSVRRVVCAVDCGVVVNPDTVKAQVESGVIFGISAALFGEITFSNGRVEQSNFHDYRVLRMNETPRIETYLVASGEAPGGMGEPGTSGLAPALTNAIYAATGKRVRKLPVRSDFLQSTPGAPA